MGAFDGVFGRASRPQNLEAAIARHVKGRLPRVLASLPVYPRKPTACVDAEVGGPGPKQ
jgi:hypothetical protein